MIYIAILVRVSFVAFAISVVSFNWVLAANSPPISASAYGETEFVDVDEEDTPEFKAKHMASEYKRGRMAFLFGQYAVAYKIWEPLAEHGFSKAQATMGWIFQTGKGAEINMRKAFYWYQQAAQQKHKIAQNNLGVLYEQGLGVRKNYAKAAKWYRESAEWGYSYAQYNLGILYHEGKGVKQDTKEAQFWLQIAALQGVEQARNTLQEMLLQSHGNKKIAQTSDIDSKNNENQPQWQREVRVHGNMAEILAKTRNKNQPTEQPTSNTNKNSAKQVKTTIPLEKNDSVNKTNEKFNDKSSAKPTSEKKAANPAENDLSTKQQSEPTNDVDTKSWLKNPEMENWFSQAQVAQQHLALPPVKSRTNSHTLRVFNNDWVKKQDPKHFTLQLARSDDLEWLLNLAKSQPMVLDTAFYTAMQDGKTYHFLIYGNFKSISNANREIKNLPSEVKQWKPWVRQYSDVHKRIKRWEENELKKTKTFKSSKKSPESGSD